MIAVYDHLECSETHYAATSTAGSVAHFVVRSIRGNALRYCNRAFWQVENLLGAVECATLSGRSKPELYDLSVDLSESYKLATRHLEVIQDLKRRIAEALQTFPDEIQQANAELMK
jgi:hypothetical protein